MSSKKIAILIASISFVIAFFVNELNLYHLKKDAPEKIRLNQTVETADDDGYIKTYDRLIEYGAFYENEIEKYNSIIRTPGYGLTYFIFQLFLSKENALVLQKFWQLILFVLSVYALYYVSESILKKQIWAISVTALYGILPFSMGFLYYTLTESITPAILIIYLYYLFKASQENSFKKKNVYYIISALLFSYLFIIRPFLGVFGILLFVFFIYDYKTKQNTEIVIKAILYGGISICFMILWQIRNYNLLGKFTSLHPIYQNEMPGVFRSPHKAMWDFYKGWEDSGAHFHQTVLPLWEQTINHDTTSKSIKEAISHMPHFVVAHFGNDRLEDVFKKYQLAILSQNYYYQNNIVMGSNPTQEEIIAVEEFNKLEREFKSNFWYIYHIVTPVKVLKNLFFHSNLSLYIFQKTYRGHILMEILRWLCFITHCLTFAFCFAFIFTHKDIRMITLASIILFYIFYLAYVQRGIEERYTLPLLPIAIILSASVFKKILHKIKPS